MMKFIRTAPFIGLVLIISSLLYSAPAPAAPSCRSILNLTTISTSDTEVPGVRRPRQAQASSRPTLTEAEIRLTLETSKPYLDQRNEEWSQARRCLCCHTTLPFMMARSYDASSKPQFDRFQQMALEKVENPSRPPWYRYDNQSRNSNPTEAVINSMTMLMYDRATGAGLSEPTQRAISQIFQHLEADGRVPWLDFNLQPFESKKAELWGNSLAILTVEMAHKQGGYRAPEAYNRLKDYVFSKQAELNPQEKTLLLWAHSQNLNLLAPNQVRTFLNEIRRQQNADGSWNQLGFIGQGESVPNTYATAMGLISLVSSGQGHSTQAQKAARWLVQQQSLQSSTATPEVRYWPAQSLNRVNSRLNNQFASDFSTAYASIALEMYKNQMPR